MNFIRAIFDVVAIGLILILIAIGGTVAMIVKLSHDIRIRKGGK